MTHDLVVYLLSTAKGWPFLGVCAFLFLSVAVTFAWATAHWFTPVDHEQDNVDEIAYLVALRDQEGPMASFERRAKKGFTAGYLNDHGPDIVDIKTGSRRVH